MEIGLFFKAMSGFCQTAQTATQKVAAYKCRGFYDMADLVVCFSSLFLQFLLSFPKEKKNCLFKRNILHLVHIFPVQAVVHATYIFTFLNPTTYCYTV